jgi:ribose transport system ATP-binding protein
LAEAGLRARVALSVQGVGKTFGATRALDDVGFSIREQSVHALLGGNGCGKSTLVKILAGVQTADTGTITVRGEELDASKMTPDLARAAGLHFVHQNVGTFADLSVAENFALGDTYGSEGIRPIRWRALNRTVRKVLDRFEIDVPVKAIMRDLRPSTQTMIAIARALRDEDDLSHGLLVLDEPTASLPAEEVDVLFEAIRGYVRRGHTVVLVTHRLDEVLTICTDATFLKDGRHIETRPLDGADERLLVRHITGSELTLVDKQNSARPGTARLAISGLCAGPLRDVCVSVDAGEVVGISGLLGSGRSTLLQTIFGARSKDAGAIRIDGEPLDARHPVEAMEAGVAYVPEDRAADSIFGNQSIRENLAIPRLGRYFNGVRMAAGSERNAAREVLDSYDVVAQSGDDLISTLSGGNQQKVVVARWLELGPRVLLLDEPTQGVDVGARAAIHELVRTAARRGMAVLVVSSDARELAEVCDRVIGLVAGRVSGELTGEEVTALRCMEISHGITPAKSALISQLTEEMG